MPTWVVILVNGVLLAYCVTMFIVGRVMKKKKIKEAKERLKKEMLEDEQSRKATEENA